MSLTLGTQQLGDSLGKGAFGQVYRELVNAYPLGHPFERYIQEH